MQGRVEDDARWSGRNTLQGGGPTSRSMGSYQSGAGSAADLVNQPSEQAQSSVAFGFLLFFTFIVFVAPQNVYTILRPLHLARVPALLALFVYLGERSSRGQSILPHAPEFRLLWLFTALMACSIPFSVWPGGSIQTVSSAYGKSLLACVLTTQLIDSRYRWKRMVWWLILFGLASSVIAVRGGGELVEGYRIEGAWAGLAANPNDFALTVNLLIPFAITCYLTERGGKKVACAVFLIAAIWGVLLTFSRGGLITLVAVLLIFLAKFLRRGAGLGYVFPVVALLIALSVFAPEEWLQRVQSIVDFSKDRSGSADERWATMALTLQIIARSPLVGVGAGMNVLALNDMGANWSQVHNVYLQIASDVGIPAAVVFVMLLSRLVRSAREVQRTFSGREGAEEIVLLAIACEVSLLAFAIAAFFHPVAYHFYFYYLAGLTMALTRFARVSEEERETLQLEPLEPVRAASN